MAALDHRKLEHSPFLSDRFSGTCRTGFATFVSLAGLVSQTGASQNKVDERATGASVAVCGGTYVYLVQSEDALTDTSRKFGYSVDAIASLNQIRDVNLAYANSSPGIPND